MLAVMLSSKAHPINLGAHAHLSPFDPLISYDSNENISSAHLERIQSYPEHQRSKTSIVDVRAEVDMRLVRAEMDALFAKYVLPKYAPATADRIYDELLSGRHPHEKCFSQDMAK